MKVLLIVGGVLFLLLAFALFAAAIVMYFVARRKRAIASAAPLPSPPPPRPTPATPPPPVPPPPPPAPPFVPPASPTPTFNPAATVAVEMDGTVMIDSRKQQIFGALHATTGVLAGRVFPIDPNGFYIGRDRTLAQVIIESPSVSKRHVWVGVRDGAVVAIDQKSTNGTYLNDRENAITETRLKAGDVLILSDDVARFTYNL